MKYGHESLNKHFILKYLFERQRQKKEEGERLSIH